MRRASAIAILGVVTTAFAVSTAPAHADGMPARTFTYSLGTKGAVEADVFEFAATVAQVLNAPGGWSLGGAVRFVAVPDGGDFRVLLASPSAIAATSRVCSDDYSCRVGNQVLVNDLRWRVGSEPYTGTLGEYRSYVVSHEVGHWLGFGHASCAGPGQPAPIMVQQSKGLGGCTPTALPSPGERRTLADRLGLTGEPFGALDVVAVGDRSVRVMGWAIDPDDAASIDVHIYVDDGGVSVVADLARPDVAAANTAYGEQHGFDVTLSIEPGLHRVCAYAIDRGGVANTTLGCAFVDYASPFGSLDVVERDGSSLRVAGWAIDPHTAAPIDVHVYVDAFGQATRADVTRADIATAFPTAGAMHGYDARLTIDAAATTVCAYAIDVGGGLNRLLGCRAFTE